MKSFEERTKIKQNQVETAHYKSHNMTLENEKL